MDIRQVRKEPITKYNNTQNINPYNKKQQHIKIQNDI